MKVVQKYLCMLLLLWPWIFVAAVMAAAASSTTTTDVAVDSEKISCNQQICGNVEVPYPFGIDDPSCAKNEYFMLNCNRTLSPPTLFAGENVQVVNISVETGTLNVLIDTATRCYDESGGVTYEFNQEITLSDRFTFSTENKLVVLGCDTVGLMSDAGERFMSGCVSLCGEAVNLTEQDSCSGVGCCQTLLPKNLKSLNIWLQSLFDHNKTWDNPCDFAFLVDQRSFDISKMRLDFKQLELENSSILLDWVVDNKTCEKGRLDIGSSTYACGENTYCNYSDNAQGYRCNCLKGFRGNPYDLQQGCQDIDECKEPGTYRCEGKCKNKKGDYECKCPLGMYGDGKVCCQGFRVTAIASVIGAIIFAATIVLFIVYDCKRRKREKLFRENGGLVLKNQRVRIFSKEDLAKATNNYKESQLLGRGGFASVYRGSILIDEQSIPIAVKKPKEDNKIQIDSKQFHEEIAIVSQVNHKNVVKLLGLCLETKIPLLVYELVSHGTLSQHIHSRKSAVLKSWIARLRIGTEIALALDYLHSLAQPPIIHRDVKSTNILLDENYTAKVSDFGASVLIPSGHTGIATTVQGTLGYLDPEYLNTGTLTTKSDVYSFGVVLVELITGEKPISNSRTGAKSNIVQYFISKVRESRHNYVDTILDSEVIRDEDETEQIEAVADLATRCLESSGIKRPSMKEVAEELSRLNKLNRELKTCTNDEEAERLPDESSPSSHENVKHDRRSYELVEYTTYDVTGYDIEPSVSIN